MKVDVVFAAGDLAEAKVKGKVAIVIDVLRATSVMVTALNNGAKEVIPVLSPEEAFALKKENPKQVLLGGERDTLAIEGFDYGNSPLDYVPGVVENKTIVMTTSNGTRAIKGSVAANKIVIASFLNVKSIVESISEGDDPVLVCSGSNDFFTIEDSLCAGMIISILGQIFDIQLSDGALAMKELYETNKDLEQIASGGNHYKLLQKRGFYDDLKYCFQKNSIQLVPYYKAGRIII
ncbi:2-phosphosulfolactate phosphatase [Carboxylicivirga sp. N1Y90]|uniref:2-phosphosulfolactate phosphatase n=1 Tax=Carboxylicivirga fragile TaxID=3417571 RepID=UPI003D33419E|nr:2-phosphosulfolactate phosphatase [Marinilabiliaceae bacterium N1Y90]